MHLLKTVLDAVTEMVLGETVPDFFFFKDKTSGLVFLQCYLSLNGQVNVTHVP